MDARYHVRTQRVRECFLTDQHAANLRWTIPSKRSHRSTGISSKLVVTNLYDEHIHCNLAFTFSPTLSIGSWRSHNKIKNGGYNCWSVAINTLDSYICYNQISPYNHWSPRQMKRSKIQTARHTARMQTHTHTQKHRNTDTHTHT